MNSYLSKQNLFFVYCFAMGALFYGLYVPWTVSNLSLEQTLGQPEQSSQPEELTIIARMPFLAGNNEKEVSATVVVDDGVFYRPVDRMVNELGVGAVAPESAEQNNELDAQELLENLAPVELPVPKANVKSWTQSNVSLQTITVNGAVINGRFTRQGEELDVHHDFEDGTSFTGTLERLEDGYVSIRVNDGEIVIVKLKKY